MKLYYIQGSPFARMIRIVLRETHADCEEVQIAEFPPSKDYFTINPLGQIPVLETDAGRLFPTAVILEYLMSSAAERSVEDDLSLAPFLTRDDHHWRDTQLFATLLAWGDILATSRYQEWAGLKPAGNNVLGFIPEERNRERILNTLDWFEAAMTSHGFIPGVLSVQDIVLACLILWSESRGPIAWRGRPRLEALVSRVENRTSFIETVPKPWQPKALKARTG